MTEWVYSIIRALSQLGGKAHSNEVTEISATYGDQDPQKDTAATVRDAIQRYSCKSAKGRKRGIKQASLLDVFHFEPEKRNGIVWFSSPAHPMVQLVSGGTSLEKILKDAEGAPLQKEIEDLAKQIERDRPVYVREQWRSLPEADSRIENCGLSFHMIAQGPHLVGPFSHAVEADGWVFLTGQMPTDPAAPDAPLPEGIEAQTRRVMDNLGLVLAGLGLDWSDVLQCRCYLTQFERDFAGFNAVYQGCFPPDLRPARTTIGVTALAVGALVEVDCIARRPTDGGAA